MVKTKKEKHRPIIVFIPPCNNLSADNDKSEKKKDDEK